MNGDLSIENTDNSNTAGTEQERQTSPIETIVKKSESNECMDQSLSAPCTSKDSDRVQESLVAESVKTGNISEQSEVDKEKLASEETNTAPKPETNIKKHAPTKNAESKEKQTTRKRPPGDSEKAPEPKRSKKASADPSPISEKTKSVGTEKKAEPVLVKEESVDEIVKQWPPSDDWALITGIGHVNNLRIIHGSVRFSKNYDISELENRWFKLLYDEKVSVEARKRMYSVSPEQIFAIQSRTPFTIEEEETLTSSATEIFQQSRLPPTIHDFSNILKNNQLIFHEARTPQVLSDHYKRLTLPQPLGKQPDWDKIESAATSVNGEFAFDCIRPLKTIRSRKHVLSGLSTLITPIAAYDDKKLDDNVIACLKGRNIRYSMVSDGIYLGRRTAENQVDVDLSIDGPAAKISRKQAFIEYDKAAGIFFIRNIGNRAMSVDSKPIPPQMSCQLKDGSTIEVMTIRITFHITQKVTLSQQVKRHIEKKEKRISSNQRLFSIKK